MLTTTTLTDEQLWLQYSETRSLKDRNDLVLRYLFIPKRVTGQLLPSVGIYITEDDLLSCGVVGLIDAIEKFNIIHTGQLHDTNLPENLTVTTDDLSRRFKGYAYKRVKGEIMDYLRSQDWVSDQLRKKIKTVINACATLEAENNGDFSNRDVADCLNMTVDDVENLLKRVYQIKTTYIEDASKTDLISNSDKPEEAYELGEQRRFLLQFIDSLSEKERTVLELYYMEEKNLKQIANQLNVTESRISQINSKILAKLRKKFEYLGYV